MLVCATIGLIWLFVHRIEAEERAAEEARALKKQKAAEKKAELKAQV